MEEHPTGPEPSVDPKKESSLQERLEQLEREAARLRQQMEAGAQLPSENASTDKQRASGSEPSSPETGPPAEQITSGPTLPADASSPPSPQPFGPGTGTPSPTKEQIDRAEQLIRLARLARTRGQNAQAMDYLKQAESAAPNNPTVLEFIGDDLAENRKFREAREVYQRAHELAPHNAAIERKWANSILRTSPVDPLAYSELEVMASGKVAVLLTAVIPGLGQVVTKEFTKGVTIFILWIACVIWLVTIPHGVKGLTDLVAKSATEQFHPIVLAPLILGFFIWLGALLDANFSSKMHVRPRIDKPAPLDNLPYE